MLFSEDAARFYYGEQSIDKDLIAAVARADQRLADRGRPCRPATAPRRRSRRASRIARRASPAIAGTSPSRRSTGTMLVECGAIRERVSQELARAVFDAVKRDVDRRNEQPS